jgi:Predicted membrane protein involved in D-alanine export
VFLIGGFWHGAGWTFIMWGFLHGAAQIVQRIWGDYFRPLPRWLAWGITFLFINVTWVFFRAESFDQALRLLKGMAGLNGIAFSHLKAHWYPILLIAVFLPIVLFTRNSSERERDFRPGWKTGLAMAAMFVISLFFMNRISEFLYFNF